MVLTTSKKLQSIKDSEKQMKEFLIFQPPQIELLFSIEEIKQNLSALVGVTIPKDLSLVQKSHWVKKLCIEKLGYAPPESLRSKEARKIKPKFIHQLLDIFVQSTSNLQVWNYIPSENLIIPAPWNEDGPRYKFLDCRYAIIHHNNDGKILKIICQSGKDLKKWDKTNAKTVKWQANILQKYRDKIRNQCIVSQNDELWEKFGDSKVNLTKKMKLIGKMDGGKEPLIKQKFSSEILFSNEEIKKLVSCLIGKKFVFNKTGQERIIGQEIEKLIVKAFGYSQFTQTDTGGHPDLLNQLLEVKCQYSGTIDLGKNLPTSDMLIDDDWNDKGITYKDIRYLICLMDLKDDKFEIGSIVIVSGSEFNDYFSMCEGQNFKVQMTIPKKLLS